MIRKQVKPGESHVRPPTWHWNWHMAIGAAEVALVGLGLALLPAVVRELGLLPTAFLAAVAICSILLQLAEIGRLRHL